MRGAAAVVGVVWVLSMTAGCTFPGTFSGIRQDLAALPPAPSAPPLPGYLPYKGVIHVHSELSHDSRGDQDEIVRAAKSAGLAFVMLTDHNTPAVFEGQAPDEQDGVLLIRGAEIRCNDHYLLAVGIARFIDAGGMTCHQVATAVTEQGGVPVGAHPRRFTDWDNAALGAMEVWDLYDEAMAHRWHYAAWALDIIVWYGRYPDEILSRLIKRPDQALAAFDRQTSQRRLTAIAAPDAHRNIRILGRQLDPYPLAFRLVPVYVFAADRSQEALLAGLRAGRAYFAFEVFKSAKGFDLQLTDSGGPLGRMGDERPASPGLRIAAFAPYRGLITILRNGEPLARGQGVYLSVPAEEPGAYRAEVEIAVQGVWRPWIYSNPIYVR